MRSRQRNDEGMALVVALLILGISTVLSLTVVKVAISTEQDAGGDRQRTTSVDVAEAGIDQTYANIQASGAALPACTPAATTLQTAPDNISDQVTIQYFDAAGTPLACGTGQPAQAKIVSKATAGKLAGQSVKSRSMEALVNLTPLRANGFSDAIFAQGNLAFGNHTTINGNGTPDADLYTNHDFTCQNNETFSGNVYVQGNATLSNGCTIVSTLWVTGDVSTGTAWNGSIGGAVLSSGGSIDLSGPGNVSGSLQASGTVAYSGCSASKCFPGATLAAPPLQPMPILRDDPATLAAWTGFTVVTRQTCSGGTASTNPNLWLAAGTSPSTNTILLTSCRISLSGTDINAGADLAIFAEGGFDISGNSSVNAVPSGATRNVYFIQPYGSPAPGGGADGISTSNHFGTDPSVNMLLYSPYDITFNNNSTHIGQVIGGGDVNITNRFDMTYQPLPVFGIDPTSLPTVSYKVDVLYKREIVS
jgi:hypothetical protein